MTRFETINLIRLFDFYLAVMLLLSFARRYTVYWDTIRVLLAVRGRWPKLLDRMKQHHGVLVTAEVIRPLAVAIALTLVQMICSRLIWPTATLAGSEVLGYWWKCTILVVAIAPMVAVDVYFLIRVGRFNRSETEMYLDKAEHWLGSWKTPAIRAMTLGYVNPHRIVDQEVKKSLAYLGQTVSWTAWWVSVQVSCRVACGLTIWLLWALFRGTPEIG